MAINFPQPVKFSGGCVRWRLSDLEAYEARCAGEPEPQRRTPERELYLSAAQVAVRYDASVPTVRRWQAQGRVTAHAA